MSKNYTFSHTIVKELFKSTPVLNIFTNIVISEIINVLPGANRLDFYSDAARVVAPNDPRKLNWRMEKFNYEIIPEK